PVAGQHGSAHGGCIRRHRNSRPHGGPPGGLRGIRAAAPRPAPCITPVWTGYVRRNYMTREKIVSSYKKLSGHRNTMPNQAKKQRTRIEDIRRVELIEAAHRIFLRDGLKGLTTIRICHEAGMSQGILTYYFKDKEQVLFEMVRFANRLLMDAVVVNLRQAETRWDRLIAFSVCNFPEEKLERNTANAWVSFDAEAPHNPRYARLQRLFYKRLRSNIGSALSPLWPKERIDHFVRGF